VQENMLSPPTRIAIAREGLPKTVKSDKTTEQNDARDKSKWKPRITLASLTPKEVHRRTGFQDLKHLLSYSVVIYGGNLDEMMKTVTYLTFLEELMLEYEFTYGRTMHRWEDWCTAYGASTNTLKKAIEYRLRKELECRERWPMYASYAEDAKLHKSTWNVHFPPEDGPRPIMHDTTNIELPDPISGDLNRALHNVYYNMCCAKAGVAAQLCSWIFGLPLVTGHCDDDQQIRFTKILELQKMFSENDPTSIEAFLNIFDKGYHMLLEAKRHGQLCCQPDKVDKLSNGDAVLRSACVAVTRSGNERAVNRSKVSWFIKNGMKHKLMDVDLLCDVWEAWTFRVYFMYENFQ
jgi:hypothetical protein